MKTLKIVLFKYLDKLNILFFFKKTFRIKETLQYDFLGSLVLN